MSWLRWLRPSRVVLLPAVISPPVPVRPLFRPLEEWGPFNQPTMSVSEFERRKAYRALDRALEERAHEIAMARRDLKVD